MEINGKGGAVPVPGGWTSPPLLQSVTGPGGGWALPSGLVSSAWGGHASLCISDAPPVMTLQPQGAS